MGRYAVFVELSDVDNFPHLPVCNLKCMGGDRADECWGRKKCKVQCPTCVVRTFSIFEFGLHCSLFVCIEIVNCNDDL